MLARKRHVAITPMDLNEAAEDRNNARATSAVEGGYRGEVALV
jgi:hypothetical protein